METDTVWFGPADHPGRGGLPLADTHWRACRCGHVMLLHDVEDMAGTSPMCCVDGCAGQCESPVSSW
jgi:hypothetical protein